MADIYPDVQARSWATVLDFPLVFFKNRRLQHTKATLF